MTEYIRLELLGESETLAEEAFRERDAAYRKFLGSVIAARIGMQPSVRYSVEDGRMVMLMTSPEGVRQLPLDLSDLRDSNPFVALDDQAKAESEFAVSQLLALLRRPYLARSDIQAACESLPAGQRLLGHLLKSHQQKITYAAEGAQLQTHLFSEHETDEVDGHVQYVSFKVENLRPGSATVNLTRDARKALGRKGGIRLKWTAKRAQAKQIALALAEFACDAIELKAPVYWIREKSSGRPRAIELAGGVGPFDEGESLDD